MSDPGDEDDGVQAWSHLAKAQPNEPLPAAFRNSLMPSEPLHPDWVSQEYLAAVSRPTHAALRIQQLGQRVVAAETERDVALQEVVELKEQLAAVEPPPKTGVCDLRDEVASLKVLMVETRDLAGEIKALLTPKTMFAEWPYGGSVNTGSVR